MAKYGSDDVAFLLVDGYSLLGQTTELSEAIEDVTEETTPLGVAWAEYKSVGKSEATITQNGFYDDATDSINEALSENSGTTRVFNYGFQGNTIGQDFTGFSGALQSTYQRQASNGELHKASAEYHGSGDLQEGKILHNLTAESGDGSTEASSVDNTSSSTDGYAYLQVSNVTLGGYTDIVVKVRHSADDTTYADLVTFTAATDVTAERKTITGTINRYAAASWAWTGTGSGESATFMVGLVRS